MKRHATLPLKIEVNLAIRVEIIRGK